MFNVSFLTSISVSMVTLRLGKVKFFKKITPGKILFTGAC